VQRLRLVHWHADEAEERAERLRALGYVVDADAVADTVPALRRGVRRGGDRRRPSAFARAAVVRKAGLERGFVDFEVCAIDETWTGLRFKRRR
jgi:hypothetical protein